MTYFDKVTIGWQEICLPFSHQRFQVQQLREGGTHVQSRTLLQNWSRSHTDEEIAWSKERSRDRLIIVCVSSFWQHQWHQRIAMDSSMKWSVLCLTKKHGLSPWQPGTCAIMYNWYSKNQTTHVNPCLSFNPYVVIVNPYEMDGMIFIWHVQFVIHFLSTSSWKSTSPKLCDHRADAV